MENVKEIVTIISAILGLLATAIGLLIPLVKNIKTKNRLTALRKLTATLQSLIIDAEAFTNFTGAEKKEYVMTKANRYAINNKISYNEQDVSEKIEDLITISKNVNNHKASTIPVPTTSVEATDMSIRI